MCVCVCERERERVRERGGKVHRHVEGLGRASSIQSTLISNFCQNRGRPKKCSGAKKTFFGGNEPLIGGHSS